MSVDVCLHGIASTLARARQAPAGSERTAAVHAVREELARTSVRAPEVYAVFSDVLEFARQNVLDACGDTRGQVAALALLCCVCERLRAIAPAAASAVINERVGFHRLLACVACALHGECAADPADARRLQLAAACALHHLVRCQVTVADDTARRQVVELACSVLERADAGPAAARTALRVLACRNVAKVVGVRYEPLVRSLARIGESESLDTQLFAFLNDQYDHSKTAFFRLTASAGLGVMSKAGRVLLEGVRAATLGADATTTTPLQQDNDERELAAELGLDGCAQLGVSARDPADVAATHALKFVKNASGEEALRSDILDHCMPGIVEIYELLQRRRKPGDGACETEPMILCVAVRLLLDTALARRFLGEHQDFIQGCVRQTDHVSLYHLDLQVSICANVAFLDEFREWLFVSTDASRIARSCLAHETTGLYSEHLRRRAASLLIELCRNPEVCVHMRSDSSLRSFLLDRCVAREEDVVVARRAVRLLFRMGSKLDVMRAADVCEAVLKALQALQALQAPKFSPAVECWMARLLWAMAKYEGPSEAIMQNIHQYLSTTERYLKNAFVRLPEKTVWPRDSDIDFARMTAASYLLDALARLLRRARGTSIPSTTAVHLVEAIARRAPLVHLLCVLCCAPRAYVEEDMKRARFAARELAAPLFTCRGDMAGTMSKHIAGLMHAMTLNMQSNTQFTQDDWRDLQPLMHAAAGARNVAMTMAVSGRAVTQLGALLCVVRNRASITGSWPLHMATPQWLKEMFSELDTTLSLISPDELAQSMDPTCLCQHAAGELLLYCYEADLAELAQALLMLGAYSRHVLLLTQNSSHPVPRLISRVCTRAELARLRPRLPEDVVRQMASFLV